jgi:type III restriction enzyme
MTFYEQPILNSPYDPPTRHHALDKHGQPLDQPPEPGRRSSRFVIPVPRAKFKKAAATQGALAFSDPEGLSTAKQEYSDNALINEIRGYVESWRRIPTQQDWGVTPTTAKLLTHWRTHQFEGPRPFFCQVEAAETLIWLTEVAARRPQYKTIWESLRAANAEANPELLRLALKLATGTGKTFVMSMLIAWQTLNAVRTPATRTFSKGFLIVAPGLTIKDRLRVLLPEDPDSYFKTREIVPTDMLPDIGKAKIVITNYHAFKRRETMEVSKVGRSLLQGRGDAPDTIETEGAMLQRACGDLMALKDVLVINDEAHHCYRERQLTEDEKAEIEAERAAMSREEKEAAKSEEKENNEAARLWISGIEALNRKVGVRATYDLSATPFFLRGSGYAEGTLFPWVVSDFSLMDAIESGIVKLPRVPVADNRPELGAPMYRHLWDHIGKLMPKKGTAKAGPLDPHDIPNELRTALNALYGHYEETYKAWEAARIGVPPVFIVVCNNTSTSKLVYEWISGWDRPNEHGDLVTQHQGHLGLFRNYDEHGNRLPKFKTLLIDSAQLESDEALDPDFRREAAAEIEQFKRELIQRTGSQAAAENLTDKDLLREVMNTVGKVGRLGESIRCVVSVSMLTEGWDVNTVTHILGVRAFGTQLLCEQVVGRALRRQNYDLNEDGLFDVEYADILGIPFDFASKPVIAKPTAPKPTTRVHAVKERERNLEIVFPRVEGYRVEMPEERIEAEFTEDSKLVIDPSSIGPTRVLMEGIVGQGVELNANVLEDVRPSTIVYNLAKRLMERHFRDHGEPLPVNLFPSIRAVVRQWLDGGYLVMKGAPVGAVLYPSIAEDACQRIYLACQRTLKGQERKKAILDAYNPKGSTRFVNFTTSKDVYRTAPEKCHVNHVVCDSSWEAELARALERNPHVTAYVKNHGLQFEVPYRDGAAPRKYLPDFIARIDDGGEEPLHLILETKGYRGKDAQAKADTMATLWVPGVNNLGTFGRWAFAEFTEVYTIEEKLDALIDGFVTKQGKE